MLRKRQNTGKKMAASALIAGVAGYIGGILTAPKSGKDTRKQLAEEAEGLKDSTEEQLQRANEELKVLIKDAKTKTVSLSSQAKEEFNEALLRAKDAQSSGTYRPCQDARHGICCYDRPWHYERRY
jgi:gas vesicle protein